MQDIVCCFWKEIFVRKLLSKARQKLQQVNKAKADVEKAGELVALAYIRNERSEHPKANMKIVVRRLSTHKRIFGRNDKT